MGDNGETALNLNKIELGRTIFLKMVVQMQRKIKGGISILTTKDNLNKLLAEITMLDDGNSVGSFELTTIRNINGVLTKMASQTFFLNNDGLHQAGAMIIQFFNDTTKNLKWEMENSFLWCTPVKP